MSWLEKNPLGAVLASACGVLLLISAVLAFIWGRPVSSGSDPADAPAPDTGPAAGVVSDLGPVSDYRIVTDRPVFDESRRPSVSVDGDELDMEEVESAVAGAPEVVLTGVVITPSVRMATLKPLSQGESVIAREGEPLEGEYVGWVVSDIEPRRIVLASLDGESMELDLLVNTRRIEEPPEQESANQEQQAAADRAAAAVDDGDEPLSRAEEIRRRIAERREELRREQETATQDESTEQNKRSQYQSAIRDMIRSGGGTQTSGVKEDDKGG